MGAMSELYIAFGEVENADVTAANSRMSQVAQRLRDVADAFDHMAGVAGDYPLNTSPDHPQAYELAELYDGLGRYQHHLPLTNQDISKISAHEIRIFSGVGDRLEFQGSPDDWSIGRNLLRAADRMLTIGLITSRISFFNPHP